MAMAALVARLPGSESRAHAEERLGLLLFCMHLYFKPFYVFPSGLPQPSDGIALGALAVSFAIDPLMSVYVQIAHALEPGFLGSHLIRFVLAFLIFLIPSTLLGATMPFMSRIAAIWSAE